LQPGKFPRRAPARHARPQDAPAARDKNRLAFVLVEEKFRDLLRRPIVEQPLPILRLTFENDTLRQFIYASWRQFLNENSRKHKWTKGKRPEAIYPLLVNTLEPLVYFSGSAGDNLRAIKDLMKSVAKEAGRADLAAIESEIEKLDTEIDERVYELYDLTPDEIKIVEGT
jgi:hypothetical protein